MTYSREKHQLETHVRKGSLCTFFIFLNCLENIQVSPSLTCEKTIPFCLHRRCPLVDFVALPVSVALLIIFKARSWIKPTSRNLWPSSFFLALAIWVDQARQRCWEPWLPIQQIISPCALSCFYFSGTDLQVKKKRRFAGWRSETAALRRAQQNPQGAYSVAGSAADAVTSVGIKTSMKNRF